MNRRTLLTRIVAVFGAVAAVGISIPYIRSLFPGTPPVQHLDVGVGKLRPGELVRVNWLGRSVLIQRRDDSQLAYLDEVDLTALADPDSENSAQPEFARNPRRSRKNEHFVAYANCTHLGCEIEPNRQGGFDCPCHQSEFDTSGRVLKGSAATLNLEVPDYRYAGADTIRLVNIRE